MTVLALAATITFHFLPVASRHSQSGARSILLGYDGFVKQVAFDPRGELLATMGQDGVIRLWDVASAQEIDTWGLNRERSHGFAFAPDGRTLATAGDETITLRNTAAGREGEPRSVWPSATIQSLRFSPDGTSLVTVDQKGAIQLRDVARGTVLAGFETAATGIVKLGFTQDGIYCATLGRDYRVRIWNCANGLAPPVIREFPQGKDFALAFSCDGRRLFVGNQGGTVQTWNLAAGRLERWLDLGGWITAMAVSADDRFLACGRNDGTVVVLELESSAQPIRQTLQAHSLSVTTLDFSRDGRLLASGSNDSTVKIWDVSTSAAEITTSPRSTLTLPVRRALCFR